MKNTFFISQIHCYHGGMAHTSGSATEPDHIPMLEERVDTLTNQVIQLISHFHEANNNLKIVRATPSNILKRALCGFYKNPGSGEMRLMG